MIKLLRRFLWQIWLSLNLFGMSGCGSTSTTGSKKAAGDNAGAANNQNALNAAGVQKAAGTPSAGIVPTPDGDGMISATFAVHAAALGMDLCQGNMRLAVNGSLAKGSSTQLFEIPQGLLDCGGLGKIDLHKLLSALSEKAPPGSDPIVADNIVSIPAMGTTQYSPPRPMIPSFIASDPKDLAALNVTRKITAKTPTTVDSGSVTLRMNSYNQPYKAVKINQIFPKVIDFTLTTSGFSKLDRVSSMLPESLQMRISTAPVAVLTLTMVSDFSTVSKTVAGSQGAVTGILGAFAPVAGSDAPIFGFIPNFVSGIAKNVTLTLNMDLLNQEGLTAASFAQATADSPTGEAIGGQVTGN